MDSRTIEALKIFAVPYIAAQVVAMIALVWWCAKEGLLKSQYKLKISKGEWAQTIFLVASAIVAFASIFARIMGSPL